MRRGDSARPRVWIQAIALCAALGAGAAGQYWLGVAPRPPVAAAAWALAAVLFVVAYGVGGPAARALPSAGARLPRRTEWLLAAVVLGTGTFFTVFRLSEFPPGLNHDAAWEGLYALDILRGIPYTPYVSAAWGRETLTFYFRAVSIWFLGPTELAVILPSVIAGILILPFFYWWARTMFGVPLALVATLLLGVSGWHLVFSRTGWRSDFQPLFTTIACCFFVRGMLTASWRDFAASGVAVALTVNTYNGARPFPLLFPLWLSLVVLQGWSWRGFARRYGAGLAAMAVTFGVTVAPLAWYAVNNWAKFNARATALRDMADLPSAIAQTLLLFNYRGNGDDFFTTTPGLEYPTAIFLVFGALWILLRVRDDRAQFILLGLVVNAIGGLVSKPNMNRNIGMMPFVYLTVALGVMFFAARIRELLPRLRPHAERAFLAVVCAAAAVATYTQYLGPHRRPIWGYYPEATLLGKYMRTLAPDYQIWVGDTPFFPRDTMTFLMYRGGDPMQRHYTWLDDVGQLLRMPLTAPPGKGMAFLLENAGRGPVVLAELRRRFPTHTVVELRYPPGSDRIFVRGILVPPAGATAAEPPEGAPAPAGVTASAHLGAAPGALRQPRGVAVAPDGTVVVADFGHNRIQVFDPALRYVTGWGALGSGPGEFREPAAVAVGPSGDVYVLDTWNSRIQVFSARGEFLRQWAPDLYGPRGIAVDTGDAVYVADTGNNRVLRFSGTGELQGSWGSAGSAAGQFHEPVGLAVDRAGTVYVADNGNGRLQWFDRDGRFLGQMPVPGWTIRVYSEPHVSVAPDGVLWVTVPAEKEVRAYNRDGTLLRVIRSGTVPGVTFETPMGIAYDAHRGDLVITDLADGPVRIPLDAGAPSAGTGAGGGRSRRR